jgi:hypothetical protein
MVLSAGATDTEIGRVYSIHSLGRRYLSATGDGLPLLYTVYVSIFRRAFVLIVTRRPLVKNKLIDSHISHGSQFDC